MKESGLELVVIEIAAKTGIHVVERAVPAVGGWWWRHHHHMKVPYTKVVVEVGMIVSAVGLVEPEPVAHLSEYFQVKHFPLLQESR